RLIVRGRQLIQLAGQLLDRLVPRDVLELAAAALAGALARLADAIGVIGDLNRGLPARAELALADRIFRVAFELLREPHANHAGLAVSEHFRIAFHDARDHAAAGVAERADARLPRRDAGNQIVFRDEADDLVFGAAARRQRGAGAGNRGELDEVAAVHDQ